MRFAMPHYAMERKKEMRLSGNIAKELPDFLHWDMVLPILRSLFRVEIQDWTDSLYCLVQKCICNIEDSTCEIVETVIYSS